MLARLGARGPLSITKLTEGSGLTRQAITKHLRVMEAARVVWSTRRGRERLWSVDQSRVDEARRFLDRVSARWDSALERLRRFVEE
jgi:DNA-binding transcriptional ArsR family regulator